jgi:hypothetical protein
LYYGAVNLSEGKEGFNRGVNIVLKEEVYKEKID